MNYALRCLAGCFLVAVSVAAGINLGRRLAALPPARADAFDNNPQKFRLSRQGRVVSSTFNCDPRASDVWLFRSADGLMTGTQAAPVPHPSGRR